MRFSAKILLGLACATATAVVASIGCGVDPNRYPGIGNEVPNKGYDGKPVTSSGTTTSTVSQTGGTSGNPCQCAAIILMADGGACGKCATETVLAGGPCADLQAKCNDPDAGLGCQSALVCAANCAATADPSSCMEGCVIQDTLFQDLLSCQCGATLCKAKCKVASPISCNIGAGGAGTGGAGGAGGSGGGP